MMYIIIISTFKAFVDVYALRTVFHLARGRRILGSCLVLGLIDFLEP